MPPPICALGPLLHLEGHVDQVGRARHRRRVDLDVLDEGQALQALLGALQRDVRQQRALELAHLAPQGLVVAAVRAGEGDLVHVDAVARVDEQREVDGLPGLVARRHRLDAAK